MFFVSKENRLLYSSIIFGVIVIIGVILLVRFTQRDQSIDETTYKVFNDQYGRAMITPIDYYSNSSSSFELIKAKELSGNEKSKDLQIYDLVHANTNVYIPMKRDLERRCAMGGCEVGEIKGLTYIYSLEGNYAAMKSTAETACQKYGVECEEKKITFEISGKVQKVDGTPLSSARVTLLGDDNQKFVLTDTNGVYTIVISAYEFSRVRLQATKKGYTDATVPFDTLGFPTKYKLENINFTLAAPVRSVILNNITRMFIGTGITKTNTAFVVKTERSEYIIPFDAFVTQSGKSFRGEVEAFLFEFDKSSETELENLLINDTFDDVAGYAGNIMKTFGMPYIKFIAKNGETIHIKKSYPMTLRYRLPEMVALRTNADKIYEPLTDSDLDLLIEMTKNSAGYPIDRNFLIQHQLVRFPAFWVFDQIKGVWENIGIRVLSHVGDIETVFYTLNDQKN